MSQPSGVTISHIGICTSNIEQSVRFYSEALGFSLEHSIDDMGAPYDALIELPGTKFCARQMKSGEVMIELLGYLDTDVVGPTERRPMNQLGFTHLTLRVDDLNAVIERIVKFGGQVHPATKVDSPYGPIVFCTDPDGLRIELIQFVS
jgi:predicted enzyme related to lactoylglutathione lyase